jgi:hypothetical protein
MDRTGTPARFWLLCLFYVIYLLNHMSSDALGGITPIKEATGVKGDISPLLKFHWWEPVFYHAEGPYPSNSREKSGTWCGIAEDKGDIRTYLVLTDDTQEVIARSNIRSANDPAHPNLRAAPDFGEELPEDLPHPTLFSASDLTGLDIDPPKLKIAPFQL